MARLLPFFIFIGLGFWLIFRMSALPRAGRTYRPRARWPDWFGAEDKPTQAGTVHIVKRGELAGLRDAYSSAPVDSAKPLFRCGKCLSMYHAESVAVLKRENGGNCVVCGGTDLGPVRLADD
jgi:hypothetical protein